MAAFVVGERDTFLITTIRCHHEIVLLLVNNGCGVELKLVFVVLFLGFHVSSYSAEFKFGYKYKRLFVLLALMG